VRDGIRLRRWSVWYHSLSRRACSGVDKDMLFRWRFMILRRDCHDTMRATVGKNAW
jgi:hypothetical protein